MLHPVRTAVGWFGGRLLLFFVVAAALVVASLYRPQLELLGARAGSLLPDAEFVAQLERHRAALGAEAQAGLRAANDRLAAAPGRSDAAIAARLRELDAARGALGSQRRPAAQRTLALLTGAGLEADLRVEIGLGLLDAERAAWEQVRDARTLRAAELAPLERAATDAYEQARAHHGGTYLPAHAALADYERATPAWMHGRLNPAWARRAAAHATALDEHRALLRRLDRARAQRDAARTAAAAVATAVALDSAGPLRALDAALGERRATLAASRQLAAAVRGALGAALAIVVALALVPLAVKALWYGVVAPWVARQPPLRLSDAAWPAGSGDDAARGQPPSRISAVSQEVVLRAGEELLVHPEFLQSSAQLGRKSTRWLLDPALPLTSLAARLVALTRIRDAEGAAFVVSSRTDPLAEVGAIGIPAGAAFVLQPRHLVGLVQRTDAPVRVERRWRFGASAWITLRFRHLLFHGPGTLLVQGCRGIRLERAGSGRAVDGRATLGFSANLEYGASRSETFGAYLLGLRGLFNDRFGGGPGVYAYEEMPYAGRRGGLAGRGLDGFADGVLRAFGI